MKKAFYIFIMIFTLFISGCGNEKKEPTTKMIDFSDYTVNDVIAWANENDVASKFNYVYIVDTKKGKGVVVSQSLESGKPLTDNIVITVSKGVSLSANDENVTVPNVLGKNFTDAKNDLSALGLLVDYNYSTSSKEKDTVILSDPLPGLSVENGSKVVLTLSSGKRESSVSINLEIKYTSNMDNTIKVYIDGELDRSKTVCLDGDVTQKTFNFQGSGVKEIRFTINNEVVAIYQIDFSSRMVTKIN